jgi:cytochrome P450
MIYILLVCIVIAAFIWDKRLVHKKRSAIINTATKKPIENVVGPIRALYDRIIRKKHVAHMQLEHAKRFDFNPYLTFFVNMDMVIVNSGELAKKVFLNWRTYEKQSASVTPHMKKAFGNNLVFANGDNWKQQRDVINPAFFNSDRFVSKFSEKARECLDDMFAKSAQSGMVNVPNMITALTLDILGKTIFGYDFQYLKAMTNKELGKSVDAEKINIIEAYHYMMENLASVPKILLGDAYLKLPLEGNRKFDESVEKLEKLLYSIIDQSRSHKKEDTDSTLTLLDMMVQSVDDESNRMDAKKLRDNVIVFFIAGMFNLEVISPFYRS